MSQTLRFDAGHGRQPQPPARRRGPLPPWVRLRAVEDHDGVLDGATCDLCGCDVLDLSQPVIDDPSRLLGVCPACEAWTIYIVG